MKDDKKEQEYFVSYITKQQCIGEEVSVAGFLRKSQLKKQKMTE